jgi:glycosyltransferase involved in cell wall biosynthesis
VKRRMSVRESRRGLKIGLDLVNLSGPGEGLGRFAGQLLRCLSEAPATHEFTVFVREEMAGTFERPAGHMRLVPVRMPRRRLLPWNQMAFLGSRVRGLDLLHSPVSVPPLFAARDLKQVVTVHDLAFAFAAEASSILSRAWWGFSWPRALARAARVVTVSEQTKRDVVARYDLSPGKVSVVYPYVAFANEEVSAARVRRARERYGLPARYLLHVGAAHKRKNLGTLLQAFAILKRGSSFSHALVLAGPGGWDRASVLSDAARAGLRADVIATGTVTDEDLPGIYAGADALVFPSLYEGFGYPVVEAMACGTPVITSDTSSLPEVAGEAALLVPPESAEALAAAVRTVLTSPESAAKLREAGRLRVGRFSRERMARGYMEVYETIAASSPGTKAGPEAGENHPS